MNDHFRNVFRTMVCDNDSDPLEILTDFLKGHGPQMRTQCLRYLVVEHENGALEALHRHRYENDSFMWLPGTPIEEQDSQGIIDKQIERVRVVLEDYVPSMLVKAEQDEWYIKHGGDSFLQQAQALLQSAVSKELTAQPVPKAEPAQQDQRPPVYGSQAAADYLGISKSTFDKKLALFPNLGYRMPGSRLRLFKPCVLDEFRDMNYNGLGMIGQAESKTTTKSSLDYDAPIVLHNKQKKGKVS